MDRREVHLAMALTALAVVALAALLVAATRAGGAGEGCPRAETMPVVYDRPASDEG